MAKRRLPPVPPAGRSDKVPEEGRRRAAPEQPETAAPPDDARTGRHKNVAVNTTNQGHQQDR